MGFTSGGGDFFKPTPGRYIAQIVSFDDGPDQTYPADKPGDPPKTGKTMRWGFALYNLDFTPVIDPKKPGIVAIAETLSSRTLGIGRGTVAKARVWFIKALESKGLAFVEPSTQPAIDWMVSNVVGAFVYLNFPANGKGPGSDDMERMIPQPADVALPVAPVAAPVAPTTLAVPFMPAAAFVPAPLLPVSVLPVAAAPVVPVMPFPAAA